MKVQCKEFNKIRNFRLDSSNNHQMKMAYQGISVYEVDLLI